MAKNNLLKDFRAFIERGNAIDMAVGIIVGSVMTGVVNSLVKDIIMPPIGLLIGGVDFSQLFIVLRGGQAGVVYPTIEAAQAAGATTMNVVNKMRSKQPVTVRDCPYCKTSISKAATKCPNCCSAVVPEEVEAPKESELVKGIKGLKKVAGGKISKASRVVKK